MLTSRGSDKNMYSTHAVEYYSDSKTDRMMNLEGTMLSKIKGSHKKTSDT